MDDKLNGWRAEMVGGFGIMSDSHAESRQVLHPDIVICCNAGGEYIPKQGDKFFRDGDDRQVSFLVEKVLYRVKDERCPLALRRHERSFEEFYCNGKKKVIDV